MSLVSPINLTEALLNPAPTPSQKPELAAANAQNAVAATGGDVFTPSPQKAESTTDFFTTNQAALFSPAADAVLAPAANATQSTPNTTAATAAAPIVNAAATTAPTALTTAQQLQTLNNALEALGLDSADISKIDLLASLTSDFRTVAFTALAYQLKAQQAAAQVATGIVTAEAGKTAAPIAANANGGFHLQELQVRFASAGAAGTGGELQLSVADHSGHVLTAVQTVDLPAVTTVNPSPIRAKTATA